jgi:hypothetical protein
LWAWFLNLAAILVFYLVGPGLQSIGPVPLLIEVVTTLPALAFLRWDARWAYALAGVLIALWPLLALTVFGGWQSLTDFSDLGATLSMVLGLVALALGAWAARARWRELGASGSASLNDEHA